MGSAAAAPAADAASQTALTPVEAVVLEHAIDMAMRIT